MPELPEVETIKRELKSEIINQKILNCEILRKDIIAYPKAEKFCKNLKNEKIMDVSRKAKYLILVLSNEKRLIFHLRLSGRILVRDKINGKYKKNGLKRELKFARLIIDLEKKWLIFSEPRALGRVYLIKGDEMPQVLKGFFNLSYEPISPEYDFQYFKDKIKNKKAMIKSVLLDQSICAGMGNIYSDEALFHSGIKPTRRANTLKTDEIFKLLLAMKKVLRKGIDEYGTTVSDYKRTDGKSGNFQNFLYVYDREGKPCRTCGTKIALTKVGNRSTRYCPKCQK